MAHRHAHSARALCPRSQWGMGSTPPTTVSLATMLRRKVGQTGTHEGKRSRVHRVDLCLPVHIRSDRSPGCSGQNDGIGMKRTKNDATTTSEFLIHRHRNQVLCCDHRRIVQQGGSDNPPFGGIGVKSLNRKAYGATQPNIAGVSRANVSAYAPFPCPLSGQLV